jgi:signal peptidase I
LTIRKLACAFLHDYNSDQSRMSYSPFDTHEHTGATDTRTPEAPKKKEEHALTEIIRFSLIALIIVFPIRLFIAQPFIVSGASMDDTFENGQYLIVDQISYRFEEPSRGDVIIFRYPKDPSKFFIKRIIGVPGDTVAVNGNVITITNEEHPNGAVLREPYVDEMEPNSYDEKILGEGEYYVMGDNRDQSSDSRVWGVLPERNIVGQALFR